MATIQIGPGPIREPIPTPGDRKQAATLLLLSLLAAGCDNPTGREPSTAPARLEAVRCVAEPRAARVACGLPGPGPARDLRVVGGQGVYVRVRTTNVAYSGGVFAFDLVVQNLTTLPMGTRDGATRDAEGVRVFFDMEPQAVTGTGTIAVNNGEVGVFTRSGQSYFQYGGLDGGAPRSELGADGVLSPAETSSARRWELSVPATVQSFSFSLYVAAQMPPGDLASTAPQVTAVSPDTLVPGAVATLTVSNLASDPAANAVTVGGAAARITATGAGQLTIEVPCAFSGAAAVQVTSSGKTGAPREHPLRNSRHALAAGEAALLHLPGQGRCLELAPAAGHARYVVAVYNTTTAPGTIHGFRLTGRQPSGLVAQVASPGRAAVPPPSLEPDPAEAAEQARRARWAAAHLETMERNRTAYARLRSHFADGVARRPSRTAAAAEPPLVRTLRVPNRNAPNLCTSYYTVTATRVYYGGKLAIYEDNATAAELKAANNPQMRDYYDRLGAQFNAQLEPVVRTYFGDPLRRDAVTDANGVVVGLTTPLFTNVFSGIAGFVASCDLFPNDEGSANPVNSSSNHGEYFYFFQPSGTGTSYTSSTPNRWYHQVRTVAVHELKHLAALNARVANGAAGLETAWLEEGSARAAEELWSRDVVYGAAWKGNTGYGGPGEPNRLYCDPRFTDPECLAGSPLRPARTMTDHFYDLYRVMASPALYSPFGRTQYDSYYFYDAAWSLLRYSADRHASSEAAFFTALTQSSTSGTANLAAVAGVPVERLQGGWALALFGDDWPALAGASADLRLTTWNLAGIFAGLNQVFPFQYPSPYPARGWARTFGGFQYGVQTLVGGGVSYVELSGDQAEPQLLTLEAYDGSPAVPSLRVAVARLE